jgi:hypothetical protein
MARIDEVNAVVEKANTTVEEVSAKYGDACKKFTDFVMGLLLEAIKMLEAMMDMLDSFQKDIDDSYADTPDWPKLPSFPDLPSSTLPGIDTDELLCPIAQCMGFPPLPSFKFTPGEVPTGAGELAKYNDYMDAFNGMGAAYADVLGDTIKIGAGNALKVLKNLPQQGLNLLVEGATKALSQAADAFFLDRVDSMVDCLVGKDPEMAKAKEIVKYKELRKRYNTKAGQKPSLDVFNLSEAPNTLIGDFQGALGGVEGKVNEGQEALNKAQGIKDSIAAGTSKVNGIVPKLF